MEKFCTKCGAPIPQDSRFCPSCGAQTEPPAATLPPTPTPKKQGKPAWLIALISVVAVIAVALTCVLIVGLDGEDDEDTSRAPSSKTEPSEEPSDEPTEAPTRTIMIYIVGSDLESRYGAASLDIREMLDADLDTEKNNVLLYTGGAMDWKTQDISPLTHSLVLVGEDELTVLDTVDADSMGDSETLTDFLEYGKRRYPADRYSLILWNHGGGPMQGFGLDEMAEDYLTLTELEAALDASPFDEDEKLEFLGFDACLMGSVETAWIFRDHAEYFVASQEVEPGLGWNYAFLEQLEECRNGGDIGQRIIDGYFEYYEALFEENPHDEAELTLSCVDLSEIDAVEERVEALFDDLNAEIDAGKIADVSRCRYRTKVFGKFTSNVSYDLIDLKHIATLLQEEHPSEAEALLEALDEYVVYSRSNVRNASGVSIYHPYDDLSSANRHCTVFQNIEFAPKYTAYIRNFASELKAEGSNATGYRNFSKAMGTAVQNGQQSDLSLQLTEEQVATFSGAQYYIFKKLPADTTFSKQPEYLHIFSGQDAVLSADGTLSATYQGKAVFGKNLKTGEYSPIPLAMYQIYDGTGEEKFYFPCMFWYYGEEGLDLDVEPVHWLMKIKNGSPQPLGAYPMESDQEELFPEKQLIDHTHYDLYTFANNAYLPTVDANGNVQFTFSGSSYGVEYAKEDGFALELRPIDYSDEYYAVFIIEDIYGNRYTSSFFSLEG